MGFDRHSLGNLKETRANLGLHPPRQILSMTAQGKCSSTPFSLERSIGYGPASGHSRPQDSSNLPGPKLTPWVWPRPELVTEPTEFHEQGEDGKTITQKLPQCTLLPPTLNTARYHLHSNDHWVACARSVFEGPHILQRETEVQTCLKLPGKSESEKAAGVFSLAFSLI